MLAFDDEYGRDLLQLLLVGVVYGRITAQHAREHLHIRDASHKWIDDRLEHLRAEIFLLIGLQQELFAVFIICGIISAFAICREIFDDQVHQSLDADALQSASGEYRTDLTVAHAQTHAAGQLGLGKALSAEEFLHQLIIAHGDRFCDLILIAIDCVDHIIRNRLRLVRISQRSFIIPCFISEHIDASDDLAIFHDRYFKGDHAFAKRLTQLLICLFKRSVFLIELIDEEDRRQLAR